MDGLRASARKGDRGTRPAGRACYILTMAWTRVGPGDYWVSDDNALLDTEQVHGWMSRESYWAAGRTREVTERSLEHSLCVGLYPPDGTDQAGFARIVTDYATFCWLCDVFVDAAHRGNGLGTFLVQATLDHPHVAGLRTVLMAVPERSLYRRLGFGELIRPERWMERPSAAG
jgi:GNAT superfamily N-acetyltransferase